MPRLPVDPTVARARLSQRVVEDLKAALAAPLTEPPPSAAQLRARLLQGDDAQLVHHLQALQAEGRSPEPFLELVGVYPNEFQLGAPSGSARDETLGLSGAEVERLLRRLSYPDLVFLLRELVHAAPATRAEVLKKLPWLPASLQASVCRALLDGLRATRRPEDVETAAQRFLLDLSSAIVEYAEKTVLAEPAQQARRRDMHAFFQTYFQSVRDEFPVPFVPQPITLPSRASASVVGATARILDSAQRALSSVVPESTRQGVRRSSWGAYALLNLWGLGRTDGRELGVRFTESLLVDVKLADAGLGEAALRRAVRRTFLEAPFLWSDRQGKPTAEDPRIAPLVDRMRHAAEQDVRGEGGRDADVDVFLSCAAVGGLAVKFRPAVLVARDEEAVAPTLRALIRHRPFVFVLREVPGLRHGRPTTSVLLHVNHEFLDGMNAVYYLQQFVRQLGWGEQRLERVTWAERQRVHAESDQLHNVMYGASTARAGEPRSEFIQHSFALPPEVAEELHKYHFLVLRRAVSLGLNISFPTFVQLALMGYLFEVNGKDVRGGVLGFSPDVETMLRHFAVGDAKTFIQALSVGPMYPKGARDPREAAELVEQRLEEQRMLELTGISFRDKENVTYGTHREVHLYDPALDNVENVIAPFTRTLPLPPLRVLNSAFQLPAANAAIPRTGQVMTSVFPETFRTPHGQEIRFAGVFCTSALSSQDAACTVVMREGRGLDVSLKLRRE